MISLQALNRTKKLKHFFKYKQTSGLLFLLQFGTILQLTPDPIGQFQTDIFCQFGSMIRLFSDLTEIYLKNFLMFLILKSQFLS